MIDLEHPFKPGTRVAIRLSRYDDYREGFVSKVYKTGRFTVGDSPQQWRPYCSRDWNGSPSDVKWSANQTGNHWSRAVLKLWDESTDAEIQENIATGKLRNRWAALRARLERLTESDVTDAMLDAIELALPVL